MDGQDQAAASKRAAALNQEGADLLDRYQRTGDTGTLDEATELMRRAVNAAPDGSPDQGVLLSNLGQALGLLLARHSGSASNARVSPGPWMS